MTTEPMVYVAPSFQTVGINTLLANSAAFVALAARVAALSPPVNVDVPHLQGSGAVGEALECTMGNWQGDPASYAYAWNGITGTATGNTYTPVADDVGNSITCTVTATNGAGSIEAPPSNAVVITA